MSKEGFSLSPIQIDRACSGFLPEGTHCKKKANRQFLFCFLTNTCVWLGTGLLATNMETGLRTSRLQNRAGAFGRIELSDRAVRNGVQLEGSEGALAGSCSGRFPAAVRLDCRTSLLPGLTPSVTPSLWFHRPCDCCKFFFRKCELRKAQFYGCACGSFPILPGGACQACLSSPAEMEQEYANREYRSTLQFCFRIDTFLNENTHQVGTILLVCYLSL